MTTLTAVAGGGNWTTAATWSPAQTPLAGDDCVLNATSGPVTIDAGAVSRSLDCTGYTGTLTHTNGVDFRLGDATAGAGNVALKLVAGMTYTLPGSGSTSLVSTSATQQTITTAGKALLNPNVAGAGSSYILGDASTVPGTMTLSAGTFNTGNFACSWGLFVISGAGAKTLTLGSSAITITGTGSNTVNYSGSTATFTANTAVMTFTGAIAQLIGAANWNGLSLVFASTVNAATIGNSVTLANVTYNGPANKTGTFNCSATTTTVTGTLTVTGNSTTNRVMMSSGLVGTTKTVSAAAVSFTNVDFQDITAAGAIPWTGTSMGDALGNTNITCDAPTTQTRTGAGGNWSTAASWTSRVPLPQDNVVVGAAASGTITADMPRLGADVSFAGFTGTASFASVANTGYGSITLGSGMTVSGTQALNLSARSSKTITSNGKVLQSVTINGPGGTHTLADAFTVGGANLAVSAGASFVTNGLSVTTQTFSAANGSTVTLGPSTVTLTSTLSALPWFMSTGATFSGSAASIVIAGVMATARSFTGGGKTYGTLTYTVPGSTGSLTITDANTFNTINFSDASNARSLLFTAGTAGTVTNFNVFGTAGKLMTIDSDVAATHTLSSAAWRISCDYLSVKNSLAGGGAGWYAGANSTNVSGNTGWVFTAPPVTADGAVPGGVASGITVYGSGTGRTVRLHSHATRRAGRSG